MVTLVTLVLLTKKNRFIRISFFVIQATLVLVYMLNSLKRTGS